MDAGRWGLGERSFACNLRGALPWCALVIATLVVLGRAPSAGAVEAGKIGFFDPQTVLAEPKQLKAIQNEFEARRMAKEKDVEATQKALQDLRRMATASSEDPERPGELNQLRGSSLPSEKLPQAKALNETLDRLKREALELRSQAREELRTRILTAVQEFARQQGYAAIFDRTQAGVVHVEGDADITSALIEWIDRP